MHDVCNRGVCATQQPDLSHIVSDSFFDHAVAVGGNTADFGEAVGQGQLWTCL